MRKKKSEAVDVVDLQDAMQRGQVPEPEPGNETARDAKARRNGKSEAQELPHVTGPGVSPTNKFNVLVSEVRTAMVFASQDDSRYVLNSVLFEAKPDKAPVMVSTDGRRLCVIESQAGQDSFIQKAFEVIVSAAFLKPLCAFAKAHSDTIGIEFHPSIRAIFYLVNSDCVVDSEKGAIIEGNFPNWRAVVPQGPKQQAPNELGLNAEYMADFSKAGKLLGCEGTALRMNLYDADGAIEVHINGKPNFYGVIMPMKGEPTPQWQPEFLGLTEART